MLILFSNWVIKIFIHVLNLQIYLIDHFTAVLPFIHLVSLLFRFTIECVTQYSVLWSSLFYQSKLIAVFSLMIQVILHPYIPTNHNSTSCRTVTITTNKAASLWRVSVTCGCSNALIFFSPTLLCLVDATLRSSVNRVAEYLCVATDWRDDCRVATPAPAVPPWRGAVVWCRVGGVVWGPAGYSRLRHGRGKSGTCPYMHRGQ